MNQLRKSINHSDDSIGAKWHQSDFLLNAFQHLWVKEGFALGLYVSRYTIRSTLVLCGIDLTHPDVIRMEPVFSDELPPIPEGLAYYGADSIHRSRRLNDSEIPPIPDWIRFEMMAILDDDGSAMALFERSVFMRWMRELSSGDTQSHTGIVINPVLLCAAFTPPPWNTPLDSEEILCRLPTVYRSIPREHPILQDCCNPEIDFGNAKVVDCVRFAFREDWMFWELIQQIDCFSRNRYLWSDQQIFAQGDHSPYSNAQSECMGNDDVIIE